jgi:4-hydroxybenzoate polyprenyltransferase
VKIGKRELLKEYCRLVRLQSAGFPSIIPVLGALCSGGRDLLHLGALFAIGLLLYILGSALNEYMDIEVDRLSKHLSKKPLVKGTIPKRNALIITIIAGVVALLLGLSFNIWAFGILLLSLSSAVFYDLFSKKLLGIEAALAVWATSLFLFGAVTVSISLSPIIYVLALLVFLRLMFETSVEGGLKDIEHDPQVKAKTFPNIFGVRVAGDRIHMPYLFKAYAFSLEIVFVLFMFVLFLFFDLDVTILHVLVLTVLILGMFSTMRFLRLQQFQRRMILRTAGLHELLAFIALGVMLAPLIGALTVFLMIFFATLWQLVLSQGLYGGFLPNI